MNIDVRMTASNSAYFDQLAQSYAAQHNTSTEEAKGALINNLVQLVRNWGAVIVPADDSNDTVEPETTPCDRCDDDCTKLNAKIGTCQPCIEERGG